MVCFSSNLPAFQLCLEFLACLSLPKFQALSPQFREVDFLCSLPYSRFLQVTVWSPLSVSLPLGSESCTTHGPKVWKQWICNPKPETSVSSFLVVCGGDMVKSNPYYSRVVPQGWGWLKCHSLTCLMSKSPLCDSAAPLICCRVLRLLWPERLYVVLKVVFSPYNMAPSVQVNYFIWCSFEKQRSVPAGGITPWLDLLSLQLSRFSNGHFQSTQFLPYGLT